MHEDYSPPDDSAIGALFGDARLVFGAVLVAGTPTILECIDRDRFADESVDDALTAAFASIGADLIPFVVDAADRLEDVPSAPSGPNTGGDHPRLTTFDEAVAAVSDGGAYYLLANTKDGVWKRARSVDASHPEIEDPETARYRVASALTAETSDRIGERNGSPEEIEIIGWSN